LIVSTVICVNYGMPYDIRVKFNENAIYI